jgi:hypothetical protein
MLSCVVERMLSLINLSVYLLYINFNFVSINSVLRPVDYWSCWTHIVLIWYSESYIIYVLENIENEHKKHNVYELLKPRCSEEKG